MKDTDLAALLCSRLCHDLVSPVGALSNGVELLADGDQDGGPGDAMADQVLPLLESSARQTANRLQFYRLAFGAAAGFGARVDAWELHKTLTDVFDSGRITLVWNVECQDFAKDAAKVLLNLAMTAGEAIIRNGQLTVAASSDGHFSLTVEAARIVLSEAAEAALISATPPPMEDARAATAYLARRVTDDLGGRLTIDDEGTERKRFSVDLPTA